MALIGKNTEERTINVSTSAVMAATEFVAKAKAIAENYKTTYMLGPWGWPATQTMIDRACTSEANGAKNKTWLSYANAIKGKGFIFDCVGLIKGILWGWSGNLSKNYGGAGYACNGVPDIGADTMIAKCSGVSTNFSNIVPGEVVWMSGHIGIYIGNGVVVESTPRWKWGVQKSTILNVVKSQVIGTVGTRTWTKHGKLPYVSYTGASTSTASAGAATSTTATAATVTTERKAAGAAKSFDKSLAGTYTVTAGGGLHIRDGAGTGKKSLTLLPRGTKVQNYGYFTEVNGVKWLYIQVTYQGVKYTGFSSGKYLSK